MSPKHRSTPEGWPQWQDLNHWAGAQGQGPNPGEKISPGQGRAGKHLLYTKEDLGTEKKEGGAAGARIVLSQLPDNWEKMGLRGAARGD